MPKVIPDAAQAPVAELTWAAAGERRRQRGFVRFCVGGAWAVLGDPLVRRAFQEALVCQFLLSLADLARRLGDLL